MRIGTPDDGNAAAGKTQRIAYDTLADGLRPWLQRPDPSRRRRARLPPTATAVDRVHDALAADPGVAAVTAPVFNAARDTAVLTVNPTTGPQDAKTDAARPPPPRRRAPRNRRRHRTPR